MSPCQFKRLFSTASITACGTLTQVSGGLLTEPIIEIGLIFSELSEEFVSGYSKESMFTSSVPRHLITRLRLGMA
jgi:hypothetical protein